MIRVLSVFGTRPEAIKMAPLLREFEKRSEFLSLVCVSAQHREMLDQVLRVFDIRPDYDLDLMRPGQSLGEITAGTLRGLDAVFSDARPDLVLVHGDTNSCLAAALAAFYRQIPIGHVEAGLRSFDPKSPFPEEMNRQLTDRLCELLFAPTERSRGNLLREGIPDERIAVTGNTVVDALRISLGLPCSTPLLKQLPRDSALLILTAHRRENLGAPLRRIFRAAVRLVEANPDCLLVCPLHRNPAVRVEAQKILAGHERILPIEPPALPCFHRLLERSTLILTDSGGVQEEGAALGRPVLVLRDKTERPEAVDCGAIRLIGTDEETIFCEAERLLHDPAACEEMSRAPNPFGDGHAAERIADRILAHFT